MQKKGSPDPGVTYDEAVEEALCFAWIDSKTNRIDEHRFKVMMTPRKPGSVWAASNRERVTRLMREGRMAPAGLQSVERAKRDGTWESLTSVDQLEIPSDLAKALRANRRAKENFEAFPPGSRKMILYWISSAKRPQTRERRVRETVEQAERNIRAAQ
jgi:uncharacterized protein YdeI (YjbR/CyaY-like superfamily)